MENSELTPAAANEAEPETLLKLTKPYKFEGHEYTEVDLAGLDSLTASDMIAAEKYLNRTGIISPIPDMTMEYVCFIAGKTSGLPVEFFKGLPPRDATKLKNKITGFFYTGD